MSRDCSGEARKSARKSAPGVPFQAGADRRRGRGPKKGTGGRPPDAFKALCQDLASGKVTVANVRAILTDKDHPQFMPALRWATENGYGKPSQAVELTGKDGAAVPVTCVVKFAGMEIPL